MKFRSSFPRKIKVFAGLSAAAILATACGSSTAASSTSSTSAGSSSSKTLTEAQIATYTGANRQNLLVAGAKKEGQLDYWYVDAIQADAKNLIAAFQKKYPFIKVNPFYGNPNVSLTKLKTAYAAGKNPVDVIQLDNFSAQQLIGGNYVQPFNSPFSKDLAKRALQQNSSGGILAANPVYYQFGVMWNTSLLPKGFTVKSWSDLLNPILKNKMVMPTSFTSTLFAGEGAAAETSGASAYFKALGGQNIHFVSGSADEISNLVADGQYALTPNVYESYYLQHKAAGAPVAFSPLSPQFVVTFSYSLLKNAPDPYAAMLFLDFVMSTQGAKLVNPNPGYFTALSGKLPSSVNMPFGSSLTSEEKTWQSDLKLVENG